MTDEAKVEKMARELEGPYRVMEVIDPEASETVLEVRCIREGHPDIVIGHSAVARERDELDTDALNCNQAYWMGRADQAVAEAAGNGAALAAMRAERDEAIGRALRAEEGLMAWRSGDVKDGRRA